MAILSMFKREKTVNQSSGLLRYENLLVPFLLLIGTVNVSNRV